MATYVLIHGGGDRAWHWHLVAAELRERAHDVVAVDLPSEDESAGLSEYADRVVGRSARAATWSWARTRWAGSPLRSCARGCRPSCF